MFLEVEAAAAMGEQGRAPAGTDQLDLEAAEQLIQLSGGDGDGESETRSADSVKYCRTKKEKEAAVESRRRRSAVAERVPARKGGAGAEDCDGLADDGEPRKRPRFRSLADLYRETAKKRRAAGEEGESTRKMKRAADEEGESTRKMRTAAGEEDESSMKKKRAGDEVMLVEASKEIRRVW